MLSPQNDMYAAVQRRALNAAGVERGDGREIDHMMRCLVLVIRSQRMQELMAEEADLAAVADV
jgi:hypothetical protein